jgi:serine/threonine protein kinase
VKQIKLPDDLNNDKAFQSRVDCVLKDIEVMNHPPIAQHQNILTLLGYGWGLRKGDVIPFIVTEYASLGTLRDYLQAKCRPLKTRLALCSQVACGLNRLHWTGIAHGDLKLENVLVFPHSNKVCHCRGVSNYDADVVAKLVSAPGGCIRLDCWLAPSHPSKTDRNQSDFGHACLFSDEQADGVTQSYRGTIW